MNDKPFFVVTSTGKNTPFVKKCVESVRAQKYPYFRHHYIGADLRTASEAASLSDGRLTSSFSPLPVVENVWNFWQTLRPSDIIVWLDGDDWLAHDEVLRELAGVYSFADVWLTYGGLKFDRDPGFYNPYFGTRYPPGSNVREEAWRATHLKTFRAGLVRKVREQSLRQHWICRDDHSSGLPCGAPFVEYCTDRTFMFPMLEMAGERYATAGSDPPLMIYNYSASFGANNADLLRKAAEEETRVRLHAQAPYERLTVRPW